MATSKPTFGATIVPTESTTDYTHNPPSSTLTSPALTPAASRDDMTAFPPTTTTTPNLIPIHSPFYTHPPASFERVHSRTTSKDNIHLTTTEKDLESGPSSWEDTTHPFENKRDLDINIKECRMWPSKQTLLAQKEVEKRQKRSKRVLGGITAPVRDRWTGLTKRQRLGCKIGVAVVVVGVLVAIGVGISKAVDGTYWSKDGSQQEVGQS